MSTQHFKARKPLPSDTEFLLKTWSRVICKEQPKKLSRSRGPKWKAINDAHDSPTTKTAAWPHKLFYHDYQESVIVPLMRTSDARVVYPNEDPSLIIGFVVGKAIPDLNVTLVHFAYTRNNFRRMGVCEFALSELGYERGHEVVATDWSKFLERFERDDLIYNPLALYSVTT